MQREKPHHHHHSHHYRTIIVNSLAINIIYVKHARLDRKATIKLYKRVDDRKMLKIL